MILSSSLILFSLLLSLSIYLCSRFPSSHRRPAALPQFLPSLRSLSCVFPLSFILHKLFSMKMYSQVRTVCVCHSSPPTRHRPPPWSVPSLLRPFPHANQIAFGGSREPTQAPSPASHAATSSALTIERLLSWRISFRRVHFHRAHTEQNGLLSSSEMLFLVSVRGALRLNGVLAYNFPPFWHALMKADCLIG